MRSVRVGGWAGLGLAVAVVCAFPASAATHRVPLEYPTVQAGLDASAPGDTVLVAPGTYTDSEVRIRNGIPATACAFMVDGVVLRSEGGAEVTILDIQGGQVGPSRVVRFTDLPSEGTAIDGFTLTGASLGSGGAYVALVGKATFRNCIFRDMDAGGSSGGGIAANGNIDVIDCEFVNCLGATGGGIYHSGGRLVLTGTAFRECEAGAHLEGGDGESALIEDCVFLDNGREGNGGALFITHYDNGVEIRRSWFEGNVAGNDGGAIAWGGWETKLIEDCVFVNNGTTGVYAEGGAVSIGVSVTIRGSTFYGSYQNGSPFGGATLVVFNGTAQFENNVVMGSLGGTAITGVIESSCNVFWDNADGIGAPLGPTDREVDPEFCAPEQGDFTVQENSPCVEPGALGCGQIGALGTGCGVVSLELRSWATIKSLHRNGERR